MDELRDRNGARSRRVVQWGGLGLAVVAAVWVFHGVDPREIWQRLTVQNKWWVVAAVAADVLGYVIQGVRWKLLLAPVGRWRAAEAVRAIYAGLFVNELVPMRPGEILRGYLMARRLAVRFSDVLPSMVLERILDGVWLVGVAALTTLFVPLPASVVAGSRLLGIGVAAAGAAVVVIAAAPRFLKVPEESLVSRVGATVRRCVFTLNVIPAALLSSLLPLSQALAFGFALKAFGIPVSPAAGIAVLVIVRIGTAIPNAPANLGMFQFLVVFGLGLFGIDRPTATAFSLAVFLIFTIPLWAIGGVAFLSEGLSVTRIRPEFGELDPVEETG